jgi:outer membrane lipoprotein-sorting protein
MRTRLGLALVHASLLLVLPVHSQQLVVRDPQALAVVQQAHAAMGGSAALAFADTVIQATVTYPANPNASSTIVTVKTKGADRMRWESPSGDAVVARNGRSVRFSSGRWQQTHNPNARNQRYTHLPILLLANELVRGNASLTYAGTDTVDGRAAHRLRLARVSSLGTEQDEKYTNDSEIDVLVDAQTFLVLKISFQYLSSTDWRVSAPMEVYYSDYRVVGGIALPFRQRTVFSGNPIIELQITSFSANVGLADSEFEGR